MTCISSETMWRQWGLKDKGNCPELSDEFVKWSTATRTHKNEMNEMSSMETTCHCVELLQTGQAFHRNLSQLGFWKHVPTYFAPCYVALAHRVWWYSLLCNFFICPVIANRPGTVILLRSLFSRPFQPHCHIISMSCFTFLWFCLIFFLNFFCVSDPVFSLFSINKRFYLWSIEMTISTFLAQYLFTGMVQSNVNPKSLTMTSISPYALRHMK